MIVRPAQAGDAAQVATIANHYIRTTTVSFNEVEKNPDDVARDMARRAQAGQAALVAEGRNGQVIGYATYGAFRAGTGYRETREHTVLVNYEAAGRGVGHALMMHLIDHARGQGVHSLIGGISAENTGALRFHARLGFDEIGRVTEAGLKFGRRIDLVLVQKRLLAA